MMLPGKSHKQLLQLLQLLHLLHSDLPDRKHPSGAQHSRHEPEVLLSDLEVDSLPEPGRLPHLPPAGGDQEGVLQMAGGQQGEDEAQHLGWQHRVPHGLEKIVFITRLPSKAIRDKIPSFWIFLDGLNPPPLYLI